MDTRFPIGIMSARGFGDDRGPGITAYFEGFAIPDWGRKWRCASFEPGM
jgi:hypothetical protein